MRADAQSGREEIYIGKGRKVTDDPRKYPVRGSALVRALIWLLLAHHAPSCAHRRAPALTGSTRLRAQDKEMGGLVGGWAGGEKELKDWAAVPFSALDPQLRGALDKFAKKPEDAPSVRHRLRSSRCAQPAGAVMLKRSSTSPA